MVDACGYAEWQGVRFWATTSWPIFIVNIHYELAKMPHPGGYKRRPS